MHLPSDELVMHIVWNQKVCKRFSFPDLVCYFPPPRFQILRKVPEIHTLFQLLDYLGKCGVVREEELPIELIFCLS